MRKVVFAVAVVIGIIALLLAFAPAAQAHPNVDLKHICSLEDRPREKFQIVNNTNRALTVKLVTNWDRKTVELGPLAGDRLTAKVSRGSASYAKVKYGGDVLDKVYIQYKRCE